MKEIVIVSPFASISEVSRHLININNFDNVDILDADPENVIELTRAAQEAGARVVISRGGFYEKISAGLAIPIVEIKVTAFDLIDIFKKIKHSGEKGLISVIGHRDVIYGAEIIADVMGMKTECFQTTDKQDIYEKLEQQINRGVRIFVGDNNIKVATARPDCQVFLIHSGEQAMLTAIQQAEGILYASRQQKEKAQQFSAIIDFVHDGIVAVDNQGLITVFNNAAEKIIGFPRQDAIGKKVTDVIPQTRILDILESAHPDTGQIQRLDEQTVVVSNQVPVIVDGKIRGAVSTYQDITEVQNLEQKIRIKLSEKGFVAQYNFKHIIHNSQVMTDCISAARKFSAYDASVLILGPSGVGKELFAQSIHNSSKRKNSPFVAINCGALPESLIESELFGYVEGSFTGATRKGKPGLFEMAHGGTFFLDEISELPLLLQSRLLRVLQERQVMRLGDNKLIPIDIRIICASNRNLRDLVSKNLFRSDLYFRIAILNLYIPPLSEREGDVELLCMHFLKEFSERYRKGNISLCTKAIEFIRRYDFTGNVRELRGMVERAVIVCEGNTIKADDLNDAPAPGSRGLPGELKEQTALFQEGQSLKDLEDHYIDYIFNKTGQSISETSAILGIGRTTLWRKIGTRSPVKK